MRSVASALGAVEVEALLEREEKLKELIEQVDWDILRKVDEYVLRLGLANPASESPVLRDFETDLSKEGYSMSTRYCQLFGNATGDYEIVIRRTKLKSGIVEK